MVQLIIEMQGLSVDSNKSLHIYWKMYLLVHEEKEDVELFMAGKKNPIRIKIKPRSCLVKQQPVHFDTKV